MQHPVNSLVRLSGQYEKVVARRVLRTRQRWCEYYEFIAPSGQRYGLTLAEVERNAEVHDPSEGD